MLNKTWPFVLFIVLETVIYGAGNVVMKLAYAGISPLWCTALRFGIAFAVLMAIFGKRTVRMVKSSPVKNWLPAGVAMTFCYIFCSLSVNMTSATNAGFFIALPLRTDPTRLHQSVHQEKMFDVFHQYQSWVEIMGVPTVGQLNSKVLAGDASELIKIAEAFHENKLAQVAGCVAEANRERGVRLVLISGPSSSGKTTFAKRLGVQLRVLGLNPVLISLDDYFVDREKTPRDENGEYDYEALEAIDLEQFNDHLKRLERGESVDIPRYDFISGTRQWHDNPLQLDERSVLIVEGIHGLNPALTPGVPESRKFKIYVSCFTSVALDNVSRIATSDNRLLRRLTRDYRTRGNDALSTLARWESVRRGEEKHIFPYQENADVMFNSSLFYEISVLRRFAEPILREVPDTVPEYGEAKRMLKFLDNFIPISPEEIPPTSLLREFIGGSSFKY